MQGFRLSRRVPVGDNGDEIAARRSNYYLLQGRWRGGALSDHLAAFKLYAMIPALAAFVLMALVCALSTLLALLADKQMLAFVGFAAPLHTDPRFHRQRQSVALFSYYLLLNLAIGIVAWLGAPGGAEPARLLCNIRVATRWCVIAHVPENYATTQPFLIAFSPSMRLSVCSTRCATRAMAKRVLDGIVIFGTPIVSPAANATG